MRDGEQVLIAGRYRLSESIGRGGMGEVWRAYDETLARHVAVKLLLPQDTDPTAPSRFRLEAQTAARIDHPNVVGVRDFGEYDNRLFLVMELVEGDSLARTPAQSGALPAERVARIAAQAAAGLAAAHQQGIVHRDIKPGNLLLDADGTLKIGDFGIARFLDDPGAALTATGQIVGTSLYLAPERALGQPAGPASDVYALGCVLYQLLTGRPPFQADTAVAILHQHLDAVPVPPRELRRRASARLRELPPRPARQGARAPARRPAGRRLVRRRRLAGTTRASARRDVAVPAADGRVASAPGSQQVGETSNPTTYMLPSAHGPGSATGSGPGPGTRSGTRSEADPDRDPDRIEIQAQLAVPHARGGHGRRGGALHGRDAHRHAVVLSRQDRGRRARSPSLRRARPPRHPRPRSDSSPSPIASPSPAAVETSGGQEGQDDGKREKERRERESARLEQERLEQEKRDQEQQRAVQQDDDGDESGEDD